MAAKKIFLVFALVAVSLFFGAGVRAEEVSDFKTVIRVNTDSSLSVSEIIAYDFGSLDRRGIYRDIPVKYQRQGFSYRLNISDISVTDEKGFAYEFQTSRQGNDLRIKIGSAKTILSGRHTYRISYTVKRAINYFNGSDELYWNATGNGWPVSIKAASAEVILPKTIGANRLEASCYYGSFGSTLNCPWSKTNNSGSFSSPKSLNAHEGLTLIFGFPKGIVRQPGPIAVALMFLGDNLILLLPFIIFIILYLLWKKYGQDPEDKHSIIAQYDVPENLTPLEVGTIFDSKTDDKDVSAEIIHLAIGGFLKITRIEGQKIMGWESGGDYLLTKLKEPKEAKNTFDQRLLEMFFSAASEIRVSHLKKDQTLPSQLDLLRKAVGGSLKVKGFFSENPFLWPKTYRYIGSAVIILLLSAFMFLFFLDIASTIAILISGLLFFIFAPLMAQKTPRGERTQDYLQGLKIYLSVAEKDRIDFHNAPEKNPQTFEKFLPYAIVFGVEKSWSKQFEGIYQQAPAWYEHPAGSPFNAAIFGGNLNSFSTSFSGALKNAAQGAAGGHSGFGGGGFSGGGFGGGGGGSW